jgi:hypothetical protein
MPPTKANTGWIKLRSSAARAVIIEDLKRGGFLFGKDEMSATEAFAHYSTLPEFSNVVFSQFKERLKTHREQAKGGNTDWVNWVKCAGHEILLEDLQPGGILFEKDNVSAEEVFQFYTTLPEFLGVVIGQFKARLKDHRKQANEKTRASHKDTLAFAHDRALYPRQKRNERG